ncbi:hypothetical protein LCGC14_1387950 [marine sediment metagenome]|uniref:Hint domain-containing protein n=1 Tax=marine sediment metagenome TaxID=412755 RepID=A0A0F9K0U1_9ZZZZ
MYNSKIKSIKKIGKVQTYDLHTPKYHNFLLSNGILSHNSGKSYAALKLAEELDKNFKIDSCCFKAKDFMNKINELIKRSEDGEVIKGKVILWDEFGVEHNAREFMTISNRVINYFFQTSRHLNLVVIMTVPLLSFIDSATRKLSHCIGEMDGINQRTKTTSVKVKMIQTNVISGKEYPKYLRYRKNNKGFVSKKIRFSLPSEELIKAYEIKKKAFTTKLNKEIMDKLLAKEEKDNKEIKGTLLETEVDVLKILNYNNGNVKKTSQDTAMGTRDIQRYKRKAKIREIENEKLRKTINMIIPTPTTT